MGPSDTKEEEYSEKESENHEENLKKEPIQKKREEKRNPDIKGITIGTMK